VCEARRRSFDILVSSANQSSPVFASPSSAPPRFGAVVPP
jgi:hypothetical protein